MRLYAQWYGMAFGIIEPSTTNIIIATTWYASSAKNPHLIISWVSVCVLSNNFFPLGSFSTISCVQTIHTHLFLDEVKVPKENTTHKTMRRCSKIIPKSMVILFKILNNTLKSRASALWKWCGLVCWCAKIGYAFTSKSLSGFGGFLFLSPRVFPYQESSLSGDDGRQCVWCGVWKWIYFTSRWQHHFDDKHFHPISSSSEWVCVCACIESALFHSSFKFLCFPFFPFFWISVFTFSLSIFPLSLVSPEPSLSKCHKSVLATVFSSFHMHCHPEHYTLTSTLVYGMWSIAHIFAFELLEPFIALEDKVNGWEIGSLYSGIRGILVNFSVCVYTGFVLPPGFVVVLSPSTLFASYCCFFRTHLTSSCCTAHGTCTFFLFLFSHAILEAVYETICRDLLSLLGLLPRPHPSLIQPHRSIV